MSIFKTKKDITGEIEKAQNDLADRKAKMTAAVIAGNDTAAEKLSGEIARLEGRLTALKGALPAAQEVDLQAAEQKRLAAIARWEAYLAELDAANADILAAVYAINDRCQALLQRYETERTAANIATSASMDPFHIAVILNTARATNDIKFRVGMTAPELATRQGLKPFKG